MSSRVIENTSKACMIGDMFWNKKLSKRIFLDYASMTPIDPRVLEKMKECESYFLTNPSALYSEGLKAKDKVTEAKSRIAKVLGTQKETIICTSGGTEGNNLALLGVFEACKTENFIPHIITTSIEHPSVLEVCKEIEKRGGEVTYVPVGENGLINAKDISNAIKSNTVLVSVMYANNEIGTIEPLHEISRVIKDWRHYMSKRHFDIENSPEGTPRGRLPYFHTDACQAVLYQELNVMKLGVDMMTMDGIKMYGPRGVGLLYLKNGLPIKPILFGGGQQNGLRSGTENVSGIVGLAYALEIANEMRQNESERLTLIRDYGIEQILKTFPNATLNGSEKNRLPNNINICFPNLDAEFAVISLDVAGISASYSSSCRTLSENSSSYVVSALGKPGCSSSSLRFTLGRESTKGDIDNLILALQKIIKQN